MGRNRNAPAGVTGEFNNDNMLERVITWVADPVLGDKMVEIRWSDYKDVGNGVKMPYRVHAHQGDHPLIPGGHNWLDVRFSDIKVNVANAAQAVPDTVRNAPIPHDANVVATKLADGVVHMGGGSHNSLAVEFKDYVTVIEAPLDQQRSLRRDRGSQEDVPQQADPLCRQHPQPLRPSGWRPRLRGGRRNRHHRRARTETSTRMSSWLRSRGRSCPTGCRSGRLRRRAPAS